MRTLIYLCSLFSALWFLYWASSILYFSAYMHFCRTYVAIPIVATTLSYFVGHLPLVFVFARAYIWLKRKNISAPTSFNGLPYAIACLAAISLLLGIVVYIVLMFSSSARGLSGIPLAFLLIACGAVLTIIMPFVEIADWVRFNRQRKSSFANEEPQTTPVSPTLGLAHMHIAAAICFVLAIVFYSFAGTGIASGLAMFGIVLEVAAWVIWFSKEEKT